MRNDFAHGRWGDKKALHLTCEFLILASQLCNSQCIDAAVAIAERATKDEEDNSEEEALSYGSNANYDLAELRNRLRELARMQLPGLGNDESFVYRLAIQANSSLVFAGEMSHGLNSELMLQNAFQALRKQALRGEIRASGYCTKARVQLPGMSEEVDAIQMWIEHQAGHSIKVFDLYSFNASGQLTFGETVEEQDDIRIFASPDS